MVEIHVSPLKRNIPRNQRRVCAFWNFDGNGSGHWSQEGCTLTVTEEEGMLDVCRCNHLTHFAEILITRNVFSELDENILEIISVVGCCLSIIGILIVAATAAAFKTWRANDSNKVWLHLCTAVLFLNICFLITVYTTFEQSGAGCIIIGISLHYSVLATYCWMLVISILSYRKLVLVFTNDISKKLLFSSVFSWGFPMLVIGILLAVDSRAYSGRFEEMTPNGHFCYPKGVALWVTVYGPIGVMWFVNWCLYGIIMRSMSESRNIRKHSKTNEFYRSASVSCLLAFICGIPWVFGFFSWNIIAAYLFTVTVTFQGFVLFLFFVVGSSSTRGLWARALRGKPEEYRTTSSGRTGRSQPPTTRFQLDDSSSMPLTESSRLWYFLLISDDPKTNQSSLFLTIILTKDLSKVILKRAIFLEISFYILPSKNKLSYIVPVCKWWCLLRTILKYYLFSRCHYELLDLSNDKNIWPRASQTRPQNIP